MMERQNTMVDWLETMRCPAAEQPDPEAEWNLLVNYPGSSDHRLNVVCPSANPDCVLIATATVVGDEHLRGFDRLDEDGKVEFLWELRDTLNQIDVDFRAEGAQSETDCPRRFQVMKTHYWDGLSLDNFAQSVGAVYKTKLKAIWVIQRSLGQRNLGGDARFDFRQFGV